MKKEELITNLLEIGYQQVKKYSDQEIYQLMVNDDDFIEIDINEDSYSIEYWKSTGWCTSSMFPLASNILFD